MESSPDTPFRAYTSLWDKDVGKSAHRLLPPEYLQADILNIVGPVLVYLVNEYRLDGRLDGNSPEERYQDFETLASKKVIPDIRSRFPEVIDRLYSRLNSLEVLCATVLQRFSDDYESLVAESIISPEAYDLLQIEPVGDIHNGAATCRLSLSGGVALYYKPRDSSGELLLQDIFDTVAAAAGIRPFQVTPRLSVRSGYSWVQEVRPVPCSSRGAVDTYYERVGHLLLVAYLVGLTDLHHENFLSAGGTPCVIDAETMFSTPLRQPVFATQAAYDVNRGVMTSVSGTGMLPVGTGNEMYGGDVSGLSQGRWRRESRALVNLGRDDIKFTKQVLEHTDTAHLPYVFEDGEPVTQQPVEHVDAVVRGFTRFYRAALGIRQDLASLVASRADSVRCRLLARRTADYSTFMSYLWSVTRLARQDETYDYLRHNSNGLSDQVVSSEITQISEGGIPIFWCLGGSTDVYDPSGELVASLEAPPVHGVHAVLGAIGEDDLALQQRLIRFSFDSEKSMSLLSPHRVRYERGLCPPAYSVRRGAEDLYRTIREAAVTSTADDSVNWLSLGVDDHDALELSPLAGSLYSGTPGLAVGLLSYRELTGDRSADPVLRSIARESVDSYRRGLATKEALFSYYNGALGYLSVLRAVAARGLADVDADQLTRDFVATCAAATLDDVDADVVGGAAGTVVALATLPDRQAEPIIVRLADYLASLRDSGWMVPRPRSIDNASFAHGASGVATALLDAAVVTGREEYRDYWRAAWKHDERFRCGDTWVDRRRDDGIPSANWCHGLTGLMLARCRWLDLDDEHGLLSSKERATVTEELRLAARGVEKHGLQLDSFSLCHGVGGNLVALDTVAHRLPGRSWEDEWASMVSFGVTQEWLCGLSDYFHSYSAMSGLPGILHAVAEHALRATADRPVSPLLVPSLSWGGHGAR
ncbi:type 2 lanthipeptide synthetase LanM family protein [Actinomyces wuliandei]|uniref:type 2 lanthipeptide synthetase LanM family protein n=1 Tax=Actinomyces wuliandei TaxID=2057743 RepID=UPI00214BCE21|nr:type 2 lanthipeptide synthetase LanM family protein [Actinomyces wuliandei]